MVLLELGSHRSLRGPKEKYERNPGRRWAAQPFREWILAEVLRALVPRRGTQALVPRRGAQALVPRMGEIYTDVVRVCLKGLRRDDGRSFRRPFLRKSSIRWTCAWPDRSVCGAFLGRVSSEVVKVSSEIVARMRWKKHACNGLGRPCLQEPLEKLRLRPSYRYRRSARFMLAEIRMTQNNK